MNIASPLRKLIGDTLYENIAKGTSKVVDDVKEAGEHFINTSRTTIAQEVPLAERTFDTLETVSTNNMRNYAFDRSGITDYYANLFKPVAPEAQEAFGRYLHKVGGDATFLDDMAKGGLRYAEDEARLSRLFDSDYFYGSGEGMKTLDDVGRWMNDAVDMDRSIYGSYKNADAFLEDKVFPMFDGIDGKKGNMAYERAFSDLNKYMDELGFENVDEFKRAYDDYVRAKAYNYFSEADKRLVQSIYESGNTRPIIEEALSSLRRHIDSADGIKPRDKLLNYTSKVYDTDKHPIIMTLDDALSMQRVGLGKVVGEIDIAGNKMARVVPVVNFEKGKLQGIMKVEGKHARGVESDLSKQNISASHQSFADLKKNGLEVETFIDKATGKHVSAELVRQQYRNDRAAYNEYMRKLKEYESTVSRPKNAEEFVGFAKAKNIEAHNLINGALSKPTNRAGIMNAFKRNLNPLMYRGSRAAKERSMARDKEILDAVDDFMRSHQDMLEYAPHPKPNYTVKEPSFERYAIGRVIRPMSNAEELAKGRIDTPSEVIANTIASIKNRKNTAHFEHLVKTNTIDIQSGTAKNISDEFGKQPLLIKTNESAYDPITMEWTRHFQNEIAEKNAISWLSRNEEMLKKHYIKIDKKDVGSKVEADYVHKHYAREVLGFEQWKATDGMMWQAQMAETLGEKAIQFIRENISIKNPAVLINNMVAGIMMQVTDGVPLKLAYRNTLDSFQDLRKYHEIKAEVIKMEMKYGDVMLNDAYINGVVTMPNGRLAVRFPNGGANGIPSQEILRYAELLAERKKNIVFNAEQEGVLKSFLDEGLWDRVIRQNPNEDAMTSILKNVLLTEDSKWGINVRRWHDLTDMTNRLAMYRYYHTQASPEQLLKMNLKNAQDIKLRIDQMYVNYSRLMPPLVTALRRAGTIPFASWFYRAPAFLIKQARNHPVRLAAVMATYEGAQTYLNGDGMPDLIHADFEDKYIGPVHMDSKLSQNVLRPGNWLDGFSQLGLDSKTFVPSYMEKISTGDPLRMVGITTRERW